MNLKSIAKFGFFSAFKIVILALALYLVVRLPGKSTLSYYGYSIVLNTGILVGAVIICFVFFHQSLTFFKWLRTLPKRLKHQMKQRRIDKSHALKLEAFNEMAAGDSSRAIELLTKAKGLDQTDPFTEIFEAQAIYNQKNDIEAEKKFTDLLKKSETRFLGYRGLVLLKTKQNKLEEAHHYLQHALKERPNSPWVLGQLFNWDVKHFAFGSAETILEQLRIEGFLSKAEAKRKKSVLNWIKADHALKEKDFDTFYEAVHTTLKLAPEMTNATLALTTYYEESNRHSKAWKYLKKGYAANPHPDYWPVLKSIFKEKTPLDIYQHAEELTASQPQNAATHWILATAALEAKLWGQCRAHAAALKQIQPTQSYFCLMAELEKQEHPTNIDIIQGYLSQASYAPKDPIWGCKECHTSLSKWHSFCPSCHSFDQVVWGEADKIRRHYSKAVIPMLK